MVETTETFPNRPRIGLRSTGTPLTTIGVWHTFLFGRDRSHHHHRSSTLEVYISVIASTALNHFRDFLHAEQGSEARSKDRIKNNGAAPQLTYFTSCAGAGLEKGFHARARFTWHGDYEFMTDGGVYN